MKKILVLPVRNEEWILAGSLSCASLWADHIIVADHGSTDHTPDILRQFPKVQVIRNELAFHSSTVRKQLLDAARSFDGNNAIFSFDADEIATAHILDSSFWDRVLTLAPGTSIQMEWVNLWRSTAEYRTDGVRQSPQWKHFGFIDDRKMEYSSVGVINDHAGRIPEAAFTVSVRFELPKVLHYQFADFERMRIKQAHYRMTELIQKKHTLLSALKINIKYFPTKDERGLALAPVPTEWIAPYRQLRILPHTPSIVPAWQQAAVLGYFQQYSPEFFKWLDIWDIDWVEAAQQAGNELLARKLRRFTRRLGQRVRRICWQWLLPLLGYRQWFSRLYARIKPVGEKRRYE